MSFWTVKDRCGDNVPRVGRIVAAIVGGLVFWLLAGTSYFMVPPGSRGISVTLGKADNQARLEGFGIKKPFWIENVYLTSIKQEKYPGDTACFSSDLQTIKVQYAAIVQVPESQVVIIYRNYAGAPYQNFVEPRIQEALKQVTATLSAQEIVRAREKIRADTLAKVRLAVGDLLVIHDINIVNIDLTRELEHSIETKMIMEQSALTKKFELERERTNAEITIVKATAEAKAIQINGEALAKNPVMVQLETVKKWDGKAPQTVVVGAGESILLPLPSAAK